MRIIFKTKFGSHLYGTQTPTSDTDIRGVYLPSARDILLQRVKSTLRLTPQNSERKNTAEDVDEEYWSLQHFLKKAGEGEITALDVLFASESLEATIVGSTEWIEITENRHRLLTRRAKAALGYCRNQANKYGIKGSRMAAAEAAVQFLEGAKVRNEPLGELDLSELLAIEHIEIATTKTPSGRDQSHLSVCNRKSPLDATVKNALGIYRKLWQDYGERARAAKDSHGVDWKALSHAARVGYQTLELLRYGHITFPRPERALLVEIKQGERSYQYVSGVVEALLEAVEEEATKSALPDQPDTNWINAFVADAHFKAVRCGSIAPVAGEIHD